MHTRVLLDRDDEADPGEVIRAVCSELGYEVTVSPHPRGGFSVQVADKQSLDVQQFIEQTTAAGLIHCL